MALVLKRILNPEQKRQLLKNLLKIAANSGRTRAQIAQDMTKRGFKIPEIQAAVQELISEGHVEEVEEEVTP